VDADKLTPTELRQLANKKEEEENERVIAFGYLKESLFIPIYRVFEINDCGYLMTEQEVQATIRSFDSCFEKVPKGTKFEKNAYGWQDTPNEWLEELKDDDIVPYLENIQYLDD